MQPDIELSKHENLFDEDDYIIDDTVQNIEPPHTPTYDMYLNEWKSTWLFLSTVKIKNILQLIRI